MRVLFVIPADFQIRSIVDAQYFVDHCMQRGASIEFQDQASPQHYYELRVENDGRALLGRARSGPDPLLAEAILMDDKDVAKRLYKARKSLNARLRDDLRDEE